MKYFTINTIADGYHDGKPEEILEYRFKELFVRYNTIYEFIPEFNIFSSTIAWFQFHIHEEDGVALFITDDTHHLIPTPKV